jgi:hypothetical protein
MSISGIRAAVQILLGASCLVCRQPLTAAAIHNDVEATTLRGKIMCGYQGWFRCPGDAADMGWIHWSHTAERIAPQTLCFEMWPDCERMRSQRALCGARVYLSEWESG